MSQAELKLARVDLRKAVSEALALLAEDVQDKNAVVTVAESLSDVIGHMATVVLLVNNFIANALKFVAPGVQPRIRIWATPRPDNYIWLWVDDNGIACRRTPAEDIRRFREAAWRAGLCGNRLGISDCADHPRRRWCAQR